MRNEVSEDYSTIYNQSTLNQLKEVQIHLKLGKERSNTRAIFKFMGNDQLEGFRKDSLFSIELEGGGKTKQSKLYPL